MMNQKFNITNKLNCQGNPPLQIGGFLHKNFGSMKKNKLLFLKNKQTNKPIHIKYDGIAHLFSTKPRQNDMLAFVKYAWT